MRVNSVYGVVLSVDAAHHYAYCRLYVGPLIYAVDVPCSRFTEKPYKGMPFVLTIGHGQEVVVLQIYEADVKPFEIMKSEIEAALAAPENGNV